MAFDGIVTRAVTQSVADTLVSGRVVKIHQPHPHDLVMTIRANGKNHPLFISVNPSFARFQLTNVKFQNPSEPPLFCMVLRKHLEGAVLDSVEQHGLERIITFSFTGRNELGDVSEKKLVLELMGRHSNLIFTDAETGKIIESMKHVPPSISQYRTVLPGHDYMNPPYMDKRNPMEISTEELIRQVDFNQGKMNRQLLQLFSGLSPLIIDEILDRSGFLNSRTLSDSFQSVMDDVRNGRFTPAITQVDGKAYFHVIALHHLQGQTETFDTVHAMLDRYYEGKAERDRVRQQAHDLERLLKNEYDRSASKIKKLTKTLKDADKADQKQKLGELLTANMHAVKSGDKEATVIDYYDENQSKITIPLSERLTPSENAQRYFKQYHKLKNSAVFVEKEIKKAEVDMEYLSRLMQQLETADTQDIEDIREELTEEGYIKAKPSRKKKKKASKPMPDRYLSSSGIEIFVGKNNKQNEHVTMRLGRQDEIWLHTKDIPGSHVLIRSTEPDETTLHEAAEIAAWHSKSRMSGNVPVDFTKIRHVKKPNGAKPGFVTYDQQTTLFVTPDEQKIRSLKQSQRG
ncbi:Rqc2 family fibronectin-binding protein [Alkalicoccus luteus]|uniref:Rqc2 homolog RqcH n=1 Tax=Alkalicoccus luteus TaxID=1237094 RepID=A0A969TVJ1_9BACI|nr:NFACT RNA binding domain-containing protein [Alkalicoccus luteus]NJP36414.1 fibronectin/fibrinogen-binding protein [Alkalicoccus luteus]